MKQQGYPTDKHASLRTLAMPADANPNGDIFGGWIMSQMDIAGANYATYLAQGRVVTVGIEGMNFHLPVYVGDEVSCYCETRRIGRTSISVQIETWVRRSRVKEEHIKVTEAVYTFVSIDENRDPKPFEVVDR